VTFDEQYPDVPAGFQTGDPWNEVFKSPSVQDCWNCGRKTMWVELNFEAHICSEQCNDAKWKEYLEAFKIAAPAGQGEDPPF
jgi:hypothetical protein